MYKACSRCGKIHDSRFACNSGRYNGGEERRLRSSYKWTKKSEQIRDKANWLCEVCRDQGIINHESLEVHHITKLTEDTQGLLDDYNLICLCTEHHKLADDGKLDSDYLRRLAEDRERK